jgi:hypothetical protein
VPRSPTTLERKGASATATAVDRSFYKDTAMITSLTSFGWAKNGNCIGNDYAYRTDTQDALSFLYDMLSQCSK